jgi:rhodanese-related sulfurtransferase
MSNISCDDIRQTLEAGATLLDVRTTDEFKVGSLPNAKNIPLAILPLLAHEQIEKEKPVFIYCHSGGRAVIAERILAGLGFTEVTNIGSIHNFQHCH